MQSVQCSGCHDALVQRGLHASPLVRGRACNVCHHDHKGARFDMQGWRYLKGGMAGFDHAALASWALKGRHAATSCVRCHTGTMASGSTRFAGLSTTCGASGCHQANPHRFAGPEFLRCDRCHGEAVWKPMRLDRDFDHDRDTKLPLVGAHRGVRCIDCHPKNELALAKAECSTCHATPSHKSPLFDKRACELCHAPAMKTFAAYRFDHDAQTKFPLDAGHRIACVRCHTPKLGAAVPSTRCEDCHPGKAPHGKRFDSVPGGCASCHAASKWTSVASFAHGTHTKLSLAGKHAVIACRDCHRATGPGNFEDFHGQTGCKECHAHATVHADAQHPTGRFTTQQCTQCHQGSPPPRSPNLLSIAHGPSSTFPLVKGHRAVLCTQCHVERDARGRTVFDRLSVECGRCHEDAHRGALGGQCATCHQSGIWDAVKFEHTTYALEGDHRDLTCVTCHGTDKKFKGAPRRCADAACHGRDDVHRGQLGGTCDRCHLANGDNRFNHAISSKFKLDGRHRGVACEDCHPSREFKPRPFACAGCHPEPRAHFGKYGTWCERCHTTKGWR